MAEKNLKVLVAIRIRGKHVGVGAVIAKSEFQNKGDWQDLVEMSPARLAETDEKVGPAHEDKPAKPSKAVAPVEPPAPAAPAAPVV